MPLSTSLFGMQYLSHRTHSAHKQANNKTLSISAHLPKTKQASTGSRNLRNRIFDSNICKYWIEAWECKRYGDNRNGELCSVVDCWIRNVYWIMLILSAFFPKYFISLRFLLCWCVEWKRRKTGRCFLNLSEFFEFPSKDSPSSICGWG